MTVIEESFILEGKKFAMAAPTLPQEVTEHLEAAIQLSNRQVHLRFLNEAEALIALNLPAAAVMIAGVAWSRSLPALEHRGHPKISGDWKNGLSCAMVSHTLRVRPRLWIKQEK